MKKILVISLVLALAMVLLLPSVAMAAGKTSFSANGVMISIDNGNVKQLGNSGNWLVSDRHIQGRFLTGDLGTSTNFVLTYGGVFKLADQSGNLVGTLKAGKDVFMVTGKAAPYVLVDIGNGVKLPQISIAGHWEGMEGTKANGDFSASMMFVPTVDGHVDYIVASSFSMTGKYTDRNNDDKDKGNDRGKN